MRRTRTTPTACPGCEKPIAAGDATTVVQAWSKRTSYGSTGLARHTSDVRVPVTWHTDCVAHANAARDAALLDEARRNTSACITIAKTNGLDVDVVISAARNGDSPVTDDEIREMWAAS